MTDINETPPAPVALDGPPPEINIDLPVLLGQPPEIGAPNTKLGALPPYGTPEALFYPPGGEWNDTPNCCSPRNPTIPTGDEGQYVGSMQSARGDHMWLLSKSVHQHPLRPGDEAFDEEGQTVSESIAAAGEADDEEYEYDDSDDEDDDANVITADEKDESRPKPARKRKVKRKVAKKR
jgi:hypothetical protein